MSVYSTDSLEDTNEIIIKCHDSSQDENNSFNLVSITHLTDVPRKVSVCLKPSTALHQLLQEKGKCKTHLNCLTLNINFRKLV